MTTKLVATFGALALAAACSLAWAAAPADTVAARQANFKAIAKANKAIRDELQKPSPSLEVIRANAPVIAQAAPKVAGFFPRGTGPDSGLKTKALPAIWERNKDFTGGAGRFVAAARGLQNAARGTNIDAIRSAAQTLGGTCKSCHDTFRARD